MLVCLAFLAEGSGMEADSVLLGVLVFGLALDQGLPRVALQV